MKKVFTILSIALFLGISSGAVAQDIYWATTNNYTATIFKNGTVFQEFQINYDNGRHAIDTYPSALFLSDNDDVYLVVHLTDKCCTHTCHTGNCNNYRGNYLYKNGQYIESIGINSSITLHAESARNYCASGDDYYYLKNNINMYKNGSYYSEGTPENGSYDPDSNVGFVNEIMSFNVSGNDVYYVVKQVECMWNYITENIECIRAYYSVYKNKTKLYTFAEAEEYKHYSFGLIYMFGSDVYVLGSVSDYTINNKLWKNGIEQPNYKFPDDIHFDDYDYMNKYFVSGNDWYWAGEGGIYKNNVKIYDCNASAAIFVTPLAPPIIGTSSDINSPITSKTAQIIGYYSTLGQKLPREPESGLYIILYDNGKSEKIMKR